MNLRQIIYLSWMLVVLSPIGFLANPMSTGSPRLTILFHAAFTTFYVVLLYLGGIWAYAFYGLRYIYLAALLPSLWATMVASNRAGAWLPHDVGEWAQTAIYGACAGVFLFRIVQARRGRRLDRQAIDLQFPFRNGTFCVVHGGSTEVVNYHRVNAAQAYALDFFKVDRLGRRARGGIYPTDLDRYAIYGEPVYSPCDGVVVEAVDGRPDMRPGDTDREQIAGNHVVIDCGGIRILLAHLRPGTVAVKAGDRVAPGQLLAQIGNTGNTSEPHLHIHAETGGDGAAWGTGQGVPITFDGQFYVRNDLVRGNG